MKNIFFLLMCSLSFASCSNNVGKQNDVQPGTTITINNLKDTAGIKEEMTGLINILSRRRDSFTIASSYKDSTFRIAVEPELEPGEVADLRLILDTLIQYKSSLQKAVELRLVITEKDTAILRIMHLQNKQEFAVNIDYKNIVLQKTKRAGNTNSGMQEVSLTTHIILPVFTGLSNTRYTYNFDGAGRMGSAATEIMHQLGGFDVGHKLLADNAYGQAFADSLTNGRKVQIDSSAITIEIEKFDFNLMHPYNPYFNDDSIYTASIHQIKNLNSFYYQILLAPNLCMKLTNFTIR